MLRKTYKDENGYLRFKGSNKLVHRWVVEKNQGYPLPPGSVVHHINKRKLDNRLNNLRVYGSQAEHQAVHSGCLVPVLILFKIVIIVLLILISY
jgi:hypothetical protein